MNDNAPAGGGTGLQLSDEAKAQIKAAEDRATAAEQRADKLATTVDRLNVSVVERDTDSYIDDTLKAMGLDEEHGFGGALTELRDIFLADDGGEAIVSEKFSDDGKSEVALSVTDAFKRFFAAIKKGEDGKVALGQQLTEPSDTGDKGGKEGDGAEQGIKASTDGKPGEGAGGDELSTEDKISKAAEENPEFAKLVGHAPVAAGSTNNGNGGESQ